MKRQADESYQAFEARVVLSLTSEYVNRTWTIASQQPEWTDSQHRQSARREMIESRCSTWFMINSKYPYIYPDLFKPLGMLSGESEEEYISRRFLRTADGTSGTFSDAYGMMGRVVFNAGTFEKSLSSEVVSDENESAEGEDVEWETYSVASTNDSEPFVLTQAA
nr:uncharacterized protein CI109_005573 [Kwoniella shandongensis]KAA5526138.1 hypothetical protein CI109_005573 [Kwoniella shandongensis]